MSRVQLALILLTMPFWLGIGIVLWMRNPLLILIPCGIVGFGGLFLVGLIAYGAELRTYDDWDLVIRSVLHRLGFQVAPPKSLMPDIDLEHHHHNEHSPHDHAREDKD